MNIQSLLVIGALVLIGSITLMVNSTLQAGTERNIEGNTILTALSIGESMISEIRSKRWDHTVGATPLTPFTAPGSLGPAAGETYNHATHTGLNDMNGYNNLIDTVVINGIQYQTKVKVVYVSGTGGGDLNTQLAVTSNFKKVTVNVKTLNGQYMPSLPNSTLILTYIMTYQWLFGNQQSN